MCVCAVIVILAFLSASLGLCEEAGENHDEGHHCIASCSAACCKSLVQDDQFSAPPVLEVSAVFIPAESVYRNLLGCSIKHPPKTIA